MKKILIGLVLVVCLSGCDLNLNMFKEAGDKVNENSETAATLGSGAVDVVEQVTGKDLINNETAAKGEDVSNSIKDGAGKLQVVSGVVKNLLPENKQIYADGVSYAAYLAAALAGVVAGVFKKQKDRAEVVTASVIAGANDLAGAGKAIATQAKINGVSKEVEAAYLNAVKNGDIKLD